MNNESQNNESATGSKKKEYWLYAIIAVLVVALICTGISLGNAQKQGTDSDSAPALASADTLTYWSDGSQAKTALTEFVSNAVDENSDGYIPEENRIAVFDMDGTLLSQTNPYYFEWMMFFYRVLEDPNYEAPAEIKTFVEEVAQPAVYANAVTDEIDAQFSQYQAKVYEGMSVDDYIQYVQDFMEQPVNGMEGMTYGESFYLPMRNVVDYLQGNDFKVYVVSGADRITTRAAVTKELGIPANQVIASDTRLASSSQGDEDGEFYTWIAGDDLVRTDDLVIKNLKTNKVTAIGREIGIQPVLAFGNSSGDESMLLYTITDNPYPAEAFMLLCDDTTRDHGDEEAAAKTKDMAEKDGFNTVSMKDDFTTIYGDDVTMTEITPQ